MKRFILLSIFSFAVVAGYAQNGKKSGKDKATENKVQPAAPTPAPAPDGSVAPAENKNQAEIAFEEESHDFGTVKEGTLATKEFKFKNTGKEPLILTNVSASCGCTTPEWPKEPIKPGASAVVKAVYNSQGRPGAFQKSITVQSNAKSAMKVLTIKGNVEAAAPASPVVVPQGGH